MDESASTRDAMKPRANPRGTRGPARLLAVAAAVAALGLVGHLSLFSLWSTNPDGLWAGGGYLTYEFTRWTLSLGRWSLFFVNLLRGGVSTPPLVAAVSIALFSAGAVLFARSLGVARRGALAACAAAVVLSPMVGFSISYYFSADLYGWAFLASTLAIAVQMAASLPRPARIALGVVLFAFSFGCYQSTIGVSAGLAAAVLLVRALDGRTAPREWGRLTADFLLVGALGAVLYVAVTLSWQRLAGVALSSYGGASSISVSSILSSLPDTLPGTLRAWKGFLFGSATFGNHFGTPAASAALLLLGACAYLALLWRSRREPWRVAAAVGMAALLPFASGVICIVVPGTELKSLMAGGFVAMSALPCALAAQLARGIAPGEPARGGRFSPRTAAAPRAVGALLALSIACTAALGWTYTLQMNYDAGAMHEIDERTVSLANRIASRLEDDPDVLAGSPVLIAGVPERGSYPVDPALAGKASHYALWGLFWPSYDSSWASWRYIFEFRVGTAVEWATLEQYRSVCSGEEFASMPAYPAEGSVAKVDGVVVVKVSGTDGF